MAVPSGAVVVTGPIVDTSGILPASTVLRDAGAISVYDGRLRRVNAAADAWDDIPGHHIGTAAPVAASRFLGQIWLDTTDTSALSLKAYNGTDFVEVGGGGGERVGQCVYGYARRHRRRCFRHGVRQSHKRPDGGRVG